MRVGVVTLGCDKNTVDNEYLAGLLEEAGCEVAPLAWDAEEPGAVDAVVVTTCGFIGPAKQQSVDAVLTMADAKRETGKPGKIIVAGCLAQRYADELLQEIPEIDAVVGVGQYHTIAELLLNEDGAGGNATRSTPVVDIYRFMKRRRLDDRPYAFLKVSDGCNHACTFCSIPSMKGKHRSVPPEILLQEAQTLVAQGVREINLVAQDLADYGRDRWKDYRLPELLRDLAAIEGDFWIRCLYLYPGGITDKVLKTMAEEEKIVPYVDMPLQHLERETLHRMKRPYREVNTSLLVKRMREAIPGLALRTTMIVGFPGETEASHEHMLEQMAALRFERLGAFQYSEEEGTPAGAMEDQVPADVREARWHAVMQLQAGMAAEYNSTRVGQRVRVLVERYEQDQGLWYGRSAAEAPEIDGGIYFEAPGFLPVGAFVEVDITHADTYDLYGAAATVALDAASA